MSRRSIVLIVAVGVAAIVIGAGVLAWAVVIPRLQHGEVAALGDRPRVAEVASALGCSQVEVASTTRLFARESGSCVLNGERLTIEVFDSDSNRDKYVEMGRQFGGNYAAGHLWLVLGDSPDVVAAAASKLGGKVL